MPQESGSLQKSKKLSYIQYIRPSRYDSTAVFRIIPFLFIEWPFFKQYLKAKNSENQLKKYQSLYDENAQEELIFNIIIQLDFYRYLRVNQYDYFKKSNNVGDWFEKREKINEVVKSTSISFLGLTPSSFNAFHLLTYQFLHGNIMHLLGNMFFLVICGFAVEVALGRWRFLFFYLLCGIAGGGLHIIFNLKESLPLVGASASISGAMAMYLGLFRFKKIEFFYWFFIFVGYFKAPALFILFFYIGKEIFQFINNSGSNVAFIAHTGGFIAGAFFMVILYYLRPIIFQQHYIAEEEQTVPLIQKKMATVYEFIEKYQFDAAQKALSRIVDEHGINFDIAMLRVNLSKIEKSNEYKKNFIDLIKIKTFKIHEIEKIEKIWLDSPNMHNIVEDIDAINIGLIMAKLPSPETAAKICDRLVEKKCSHPSLISLAKNIASAFEKIQNNERSRLYLALARRPITGKT